MIFNEYADSELLTLDLARILARRLREQLRQKDRVTFAVPGGTTPAPIFDDLCAVDLEWGRVDVMLTDERWVPESSPRSNTALVKAHLLRDKAAAASFLPMYREAPQPEDALPDLAMEIGRHLPIDLLLLGMGKDMHIASLFPGADNLERALAPDAPILLPMRAPDIKEPRVTLTAPVLRDAYSTCLVITGEAKRAALGLAEEGGDPLTAPVNIVLDQAEVFWAP